MKVLFSFRGLPTLQVLVRCGFVAIGVIFAVVVPFYKSTIAISQINDVYSSSTPKKYAMMMMEQQQQNDRGHHHAGVVDLLEWLPPLQNYDFPAEVSFRENMEEAGVPNLDDFQMCLYTNWIRWRKDTGMLPQYYRRDWLRDFSLRPRDFQWQRHQRTCSTVQEMADAIRYGKRVWEDRNSSWTWREEEWNPSSFEYYGCDIPILSPADICRILSQFSHVYFVGDSLNRHVYDGLHIGLRNDFTSGSMLTLTEKIVQTCRCDGQFSELLFCRDKFREPVPGYLDPFSPESGVCPPPAAASPSTTNNNNNNNHTTKNTGTIIDFQFMRLQGDTSIDCSLNTSRPVLLLMNGAAWYKMSPLATYQDVVRTLEHKQIQECVRQGKLIAIFQSFISKSPSHESFFPDQTRDKGIIFNDEMRKLLLSPDDSTKDGDKRNNRNILFVDHMNFTTGAQSSDGFHFLSNTNYFKAHHYLHLANLMLKERMFVAT